MKHFWVLPSDIKQRIEDRFGQKIRYSKDCENLAIHISSTCQESISPTTLKRLFGFAQPIANPRAYTLDVLANYLGWSSWEALEKELFTSHTGKVQPDIHLLQQELSMVQNLKKISLKHVRELCERFGDEEAIFPFLNTLIHVAFQWKDEAFLKKIFDLPKVYTYPHHDLLNLYYIGQTLGTSLREYPEADELLEAYGASTFAHRYFIEWFVDEDYLQGYYGKLLDVYAKYMEQSEANKLFYYLLKAKQAAQIDDTAAMASWYAQVRSCKKPDNLHEILAARYLALLVQQDHLNDVIYQDWIHRYVRSSSFEQAIGFVFYLSRELFEQKAYVLLAELLSSFMAEFPNMEPSTHWSKKISNQLLVYLAFVAYQNGKVLEAKKQLSQVDVFLFDSFQFRQLTTHFEELCSMMLAQNES